MEAQLKLVAGLISILVLGTTTAYVVDGDIGTSLRFLFGSVLALLAGLGTRGASYQGNYLLGLVLGATLGGLAWLVLPEAVKLGPSWTLSAIAWSLLLFAIGFLFAKRGNAEPGSNNQLNAADGSTDHFKPYAMPEELLGEEMTLEEALVRYHGLSESPTRSGDAWRRIIQSFSPGDKIRTFNLGYRSGVVHLRDGLVIERVTLIYSQPVRKESPTNVKRRVAGLFRNPANRRRN